MQATFTVFKREFFGYFRSPVGYVFLAGFLLILLGLVWFAQDFFSSNDASMTRFFILLPWVYLFLIPATGMRLWAEEKRSGTWELLLTLPITTWQAVLGKFLAGWAFIGIGLLLTLPFPLTVGFLGDPDWGPIWSGYLGAFLMAGSYLAVCSLMSSTTKNQVIAFIYSVFVCTILVFLGWSVFNDALYTANFPVWLVDAISNFSFITHFQPLFKGIVAIRDLAFFFSLTVCTLLLNVVVLER